MCRCEARCNLRGWFVSSGEQKRAAAQFYVLADRISAMEKDVALERRKAPAEDDGAPVVRVVMFAASNDPRGAARVALAGDLTASEVEQIEDEEARHDAEEALKAGGTDRKR